MVNSSRNRALHWALGFVLLLGAIRFAYFAAERRLVRASFQLGKEIADLVAYQAPRPLHTSASGTTFTEQALAARSPAALLEATHAPTLGSQPTRVNLLPVAKLVETLAATHQTDSGLAACLDAHALARDLALSQGLEGISAGQRLVELIGLPCSELAKEVDTGARAQAKTALTAIARGAPSLKRAVQRSSVEAQFQRYSGWMRREELDALPAPFLSRPRGAGTPSGFFERQRQVSTWRRMQTVTGKLEEQAELPPSQRNELEATLTAWRELGMPEFFAEPVLISSAFAEALEPERASP